MDYRLFFIELAIGIGKFFLHPLFYLGIVLSILLGYFRVKRERKDFHIRVQDGWFEFRTYLFKGLLLGTVFSSVVVLLGLIVPFSWIVTTGLLMLLFSLFLKPSLLSPVYTAGIAYLLLIGFDYFPVELPMFHSFLTGYSSFLPNAALAVGLFLLIEGILIIRNGSKNTSPKAMTSNRGLKVGLHEQKRLWLVPFVLLIPEGALTSPFDFWPVFPIDETSFSFLLVPFWIGFGQQVRTTLPDVGIRKTGKQVIGLSIPVIVIASLGYVFPIFSLISVTLAIIVRPIIALKQYLQDKSKKYYFSKNVPGIVILDIIPGSPAEKMNLKIGEIIRTVNGIHVLNELEYYAALQKNRAFCKLEVIDENGENRFVNQALYEGEHHELGVIFIDEGTKWSMEVS